jgi:hypothetical protein
MNQYRSVSVFHRPNGTLLPKGSEWRASISPAGGCLGGRRWRAIGSRRAKEDATTRAICSIWDGVRSAATTVEYRLLR